MNVPLSPAAGRSASLLRSFFFYDPFAHTPGQGLVEYALILVLIAVVTIGTLTLIGNQVSQVFSQVNCTLGGDPGLTHQDHGNGHSNRGGCSN